MLRIGIIESYADILGLLVNNYYLLINSRQICRLFYFFQD